MCNQMKLVHRSLRRFLVLATYVGEQTIFFGQYDILRILILRKDPHRKRFRRGIFLSIFHDPFHDLGRWKDEMDILGALSRSLAIEEGRSRFRSLRNGRALDGFLVAEERKSRIGGVWLGPIDEMRAAHVSAVPPCRLRTSRDKCPRFHRSIFHHVDDSTEIEIVETMGNRVDGILNSWNGIEIFLKKEEDRTELDGAYEIHKLRLLSRSVIAV